jgi:ribosomal protein S12 methylthiotransferase
VNKCAEHTGPLRVGLVSLGCAKNLVDAELMLGALLKAGMEITNAPGEADAILVNTCSFIGDAQEESVDAILESASVREASRHGQAIIVSGCLPQRYRADLPKLFPEVDAFMGVDQVPRVAEIIRDAVAHRAARLVSASARKRKPGRKVIRAKLADLDKSNPPEVKPGILLDVTSRPTYIQDYAAPRFRLTPRHSAYVKIAEGCNHPCSFCIIPRMRGSHRSRPQADIVSEVRALLADGVKELNLISQDTTYYGLDLRAGHSRAIASPERFKAATLSLPRGSATLHSLVRELNDLKGDFWIRILYTHPAHWTDDLIRAMADCRKVARYADIPLQHIHDNMLQRMRRETDGRHIRDLIHRIRAGVPGIALRTTFIVGFPGETEACFDTLMEFIRETRFERLGVFAYSKEDGTVAGRMAGQLPDKVKQKRRDLAMAEQRRISAAICAAQVGRTLKVLVEGEAGPERLQQAGVADVTTGLRKRGRTSGDRWWVARGQADAPDIDGRVYVRGTLQAGKFARVRVISHTDYDLIAEPV